MSYLKVKTESLGIEWFWFGFFCFEKWSAGSWLFVFSFVWVHAAVHWLVVLFYDLHEIIFCIWYVLIEEMQTVNLYWEAFIVFIVETATRMVNPCKIFFCSTNHWRFATNNELGKRLKKS